jgi:hypothetical protein
MYTRLRSPPGAKRLGPRIYRTTSVVDRGRAGVFAVGFKHRHGLVPRLRQGNPAHALVLDLPRPAITVPEVTKGIQTVCSADNNNGCLIMISSLRVASRIVDRHVRLLQCVDRGVDGKTNLRKVNGAILQHSEEG